MAILLGDLREAFKKLNQMEEATDKHMSVDKMLGTFSASIDPTSQILDAARKSVSMGMPDTSGMLGLNTGQALADALQKGLFPDIPNAADALLGSLPGFAEMFAETERRRQEALDFYRPQAYERITPADIDHAIPRIDWAAFMAAQRPSLTDTEEAATNPRQAPVIEERTQLAAALDNRLKERAVQERAATELLAYAWATWGGYEEGDSIPEMMAHFLPTDADWASLSDTELEPEYLRKILEATGVLPAMAPAFRNNWGTIPSIALVRGALRHLMTPWEGDRRHWPEARFDWAGSSPGHVMFTLHESPTGGTPAQIQAAWDHVDSINEWVGLTLATVAAIYQHNKRHGGRLIVETNDFLKAWGKGSTKGFKASDKDRVNVALFTLSQIVVQRLEYTYRPKGKRAKVSESVRTEHLLFLDQLGSNGRNIKWDIYLGAPLLQMMGHFPLQIADITEGSIGPDGNDPYRSRFDLLIPIEARARPAVFRVPFKTG